MAEAGFVHMIRRSESINRQFGMRFVARCGAYAYRSFMSQPLPSSMTVWESRVTCPTCKEGE